MVAIKFHFVKRKSSFCGVFFPLGAMLMIKVRDIVRERIALVIGGREGALAFEKSSGGAFKRKTLQSWIDGITFPDISDLELLSDFTRKPLSFFLPSDDRKSTIYVQKLDVHAAAGDGADNSCATVEEELEFPEWMIKALGAARGRLRIIRALGDSMEPVIVSGALLLVDEKDTDIKRKRRRRNRWDYPEIFVFDHEGETFLKRLRLIEGTVVAESYNQDIDARIFRPKEIVVRARVIWWDNRLK